MPVKQFPKLKKKILYKMEESQRELVRADYNEQVLDALKYFKSCAQYQEQKNQKVQKLTKAIDISSKVLLTASIVSGVSGAATLIPSVGISGVICGVASASFGIASASLKVFHNRLKKKYRTRLTRIEYFNHGEKLCEAVLEDKIVSVSEYKTIRRYLDQEKKISKQETEQSPKDIIQSLSKVIEDVRV